jgi:hypothetical protein
MRGWNRHSHNFQAPPQHSHSHLSLLSLSRPSTAEKNRKETTTTAKKIAESTTANNLSRLCQYRKEGARKQGAMIHQLPLRPQMSGGEKILEPSSPPPEPVRQTQIPPGKMWENVD